MHRFFDPAESVDGSRKRRQRCCLPRCRTASAPRTRRLRGSIARPARTPTDASSPPSRTTTHGSGPPWLATPSMLDSLIPFSGPVYPGAPYTVFRTPSDRSHRLATRLQGRLTASSGGARVGSGSSPFGQRRCGCCLRTRLDRRGSWGAALAQCRDARISCLPHSWVMPVVADKSEVWLSFRFVVDLVPPVDSLEVVVVDVIEELADVGELGCPQRVAVLLLDPEEAWNLGAAEQAARAFPVG
jgi:hypothetical protein